MLSSYQKLKDGLGMMMKGAVEYEEMKAIAGTATASEIFRIVRKMRFPRRIRRSDGRNLYPLEGILQKEELEIVKDVLEFDMKLGQYVTEHPNEVLSRLFKAKKLKADRFAALKYAVAVNNGDFENAQHTLNLWKLYIQREDEPSVSLLRTAKFFGRFEDFVVHVRDKEGLELADVVEQISEEPPIYRETYVDPNGKKYIMLSGGYGFERGNIYNSYAVLWDESILKENASKVINAFLLGSIDGNLFTGVGRLLEDVKLRKLVYYIMEYTKFSIVRDEITHKYIAMAGIDVDEDVAIPLVRAEFATYEEAKMFMDREIIPKYLEAEKEVEAYKYMVMEDVGPEPEKEHEKEMDIGGMYG